jgi:hypothetical protein
MLRAVASSFGCRLGQVSRYERPSARDGHAVPGRAL